MKSEHIKTSARNAARDIEFLLFSHQEKVSKKLAILFSLVLPQTDKTRQLMLQKSLPSYFTFLTSKTKKNYSPEFKKALSSTLFNAITHGYDAEQAKKHILGYLANSNTISEIYEIREKTVFNGWKVSPPNKLDSPKTVAFLESCIALQKSFLDVPDYEAMTETDMLATAVLPSLLYASENDNGHRDLILGPEILTFIALLLIEAYFLLSTFFSNDADQNKLVIPILLTATFINSIAITIIMQTAKYLNNNNEKRKNIAMESAPQTLTNKLPSVITITVKNKITNQVSHTYSLPIFNNMAPISAPLESNPETHETPSNARHHKPKTRSPFFMGLFKPSTKPKVERRQNNDTFNLNGINYHRLYNQDKKQTDIFVGYTKENLAKYTTPQNKSIFKKLMHSPCVVPPKGSQGFVLMKNKRADETLLPFKLKTLGDERLLFSLESDAKLDNKDIKLYQLSGSATHNQFSRLKRK